MAMMVLLAPSDSHAQTGGRVPKAEDIKNGKTHKPAPRGAVVKRIDLRRHFPPVGEQSMNDCSAWTAAAIKSFLETIDQDWKADQPQTIFSPSFLYSQTNSGKDKGSNLIALGRLMEKSGAATLKTNPYIAKDFKTQPSPSAFKEAAHFKNRATYLLKNKEQIKMVLQQNMPVALGVRLTPGFFSGRFQVYTQEMHAWGMKRRKPNQRHALHAMAIVGFDDDIGGFLLRNSWGSRWGKGGYCWVGYDAFEKFEPQKNSEAFVMLAVAFEDERNKRTLGTQTDQAPKQLKIRVRSEANGYHLEEKKTLYRYYAELEGSKAAIQSVRDVVWHAPSLGNKLPSKLRTDDSSRHFQIWSAVLGGQHQLVADLVFQDGSKRTLRQPVSFHPPIGQQRSVSISVEDRYWGLMDTSQGNSKRPHWIRIIHFHGSVADIRSVDRIIIDIGDEHQEINPMGQKSKLARREFTVESPEPISVRFIFFDGSETLRRYDSETFSDPANDLVILKSKLHKFGDGSRSAYRLHLRIPVGLANFEVDRVVWQLDGSQGHRQFIVRSGQNYLNGFQMTGVASKDFRARATIHWKRNMRETMVLEKWVELPDKKTAYDGPHRVELYGTSAYAGRSKNKVPTWNHQVRLSGDWLTTNKIEKVTFHCKDEKGRKHLIEGKKDKHGDFAVEFKGLSQTITVSAKAKLKTVSFEKKATFTSPRPAVDVAFLDKRLASVTKYVDGHKDITWWTKIGGPIWWGSAHTVQYVYQAPSLILPRKNPGDPRVYIPFPHQWQTTLSLKDGTNSPRWRFQGVAKEPGPIQARLHYVDGGCQTLITRVPQSSTSWNNSPQSVINIRAIERFTGEWGGNALFRLRLQVEGPDSEMAKLSHALIRISATPTKSDVRFNKDFRASATYASPQAFTVTLVFKDGSFETRTVLGSCQAKRFHGLGIQRQRNVIGITGPTKLISSIKSVRFEIASKKEKPIIMKGHGYLFGGFKWGCSVKDQGPVQVKATIQFTRGKEKTIIAFLPSLSSHSLQLHGRDRFWGHFRNQPLWLASYSISGAAHQGQTPTSLHFGSFGISSDGFPNFEKTELRSTPRAVKGSLEYADKSTSSLPPQVFKFKSKEMKKTRLTVEQLWSNKQRGNRAISEWIIRLQGPISHLDQFAFVEYKIKYLKNGKTRMANWKETERFSLDGDGFRALLYGTQVKSITATVFGHNQKAIRILNWTTSPK